jgi:hypothetical protein
MKIITDTFMIKRNQRIGQITTIGSLVVLAGGLFLSFQKNQQLVSFSFLALLVGFILSQVGIYFGNRYGRKPRPDEQLDMGLKGMDDKYTLYHYVVPAPHLLVGPAGVWILLPFTQGGTITYQKGRWRQRGGNWYLKFFAQEGISRPDLDIEVNTEKIQKLLSRQLPGYTLPPIQAALVFANEKAVISCDDAPAPTLPLSKLKEFLRKKAKADPLPIDVVNHITEALPYL